MTATDDAELRRRFAEREQQVADYAAIWWTRQVEPQRSFFRSRAALRRDLLLAFAKGALGTMSTRRLYRANADWAPERRELHDEVLDVLLARAPSEGVADGEPVYLTIGLPGSGKTSALRPIALAHAGHPQAMPVSDADEVRVALPEYAEGLGSGVVQEETAELTYGSQGYPPTGGLQDRVRDRSGAVIVDIVGSVEYLPGVVRDLAEQGRAVYILRSECPVDLCVARAMNRAVEPGGRFVPINVIQAKKGVPKAALIAALDTGVVSGWGVVDTTGLRARLIDGDGTFDAAVSSLNE